MSAEHRKPVVAFVALAIIAAALVGMQRAEARGGRMLAAVVGAGVHVEGRLPAAASELVDSSAVLGSAVWLLAGELTGKTGVGTGGESAPLGVATEPRVERADAVARRRTGGPADTGSRRPGVRPTDRRAGESAAARRTESGRTETGRTTSSLPRTATSGRHAAPRRTSAGSSGATLGRTTGDLRDGRGRPRGRGHHHAAKRLRALPRR